MTALYFLLSLLEYVSLHKNFASNEICDEIYLIKRPWLANA